MSMDCQMSDSNKMSLTGKIKENPVEYEAANEANHLLENGILVETNKGLVCMSVNDALSSNLNLTANDLQQLAKQLLLLQDPTAPQNKKVLSNRTINSGTCDSDGFSSECSDVSANVNVSMVPPKTIYTPLSTTKRENIFVDSIIKRENIFVDSTSISEISASSNVSDSDASNSNNLPSMSQNSSELKLMLELNKPAKRRGGWPKGRKRKPELLNLPPKAPATGYNLYLNEQRKYFKGSSLAFHEITKVIGNRWSSLSLEAKQPYLLRAEEDKKRYREELKTYRQSTAYRAYLTKKRQKRLQNNVLSESDMDATDEIDDEDNEELYCRTCDQWFHNLHNKKEHLQGKQHFQSIAGDIRKELESDSDYCGTTSSVSINTSLDESSTDGTISSSRSNLKLNISVAESIANLISVVTKRDKEIKVLQNKLVEAKTGHSSMCKELIFLKEKEVKLKNELLRLKEEESSIETSVFQIWKVPSLFIVTDFNDLNDCNE